MSSQTPLSQLRAYFAADGGKPLSMAEIKEFKASRDGKDYQEVVTGIVNGTFTY